MKALVLVAKSKFEIRDIPTPAVGEKDVLIRVKACGICGSDVHGMDGSTGRRIPPIVMGHEAAGVIEKAGPKVSGWKVGDRVTFDSTIYCGNCGFCRQGLINLCDNRRVMGVSCGEYRQDGAFAEWVAVPDHILYRLPDSLSFERAAMVEALSIGVHAANRTPRHLADTVLLVGAGMIGLLTLQAFRVAGFGQIIACDIDAGKLELAKKLGADVTLKSDECDVPKEVQKLTGGRGADAAVEVVGIPPTVKTAILSLKKGGSLTLVGNVTPEVALPLQVAVTRELDIRGSCASCGEYPACLDLIARGAVDVDALISKVAPLTEGAEWFERLHRAEKGLMKVILVP